jgi:MYXO-CTERM domain-containing protein
MGSYMRRPLLSLVFVLVVMPLWLVASVAGAQTLLVAPYLQSATPEGIWVMWETDEGETSVVEWGADETLGERVTAPSRVGFAGTRIHEAELTGLEPNTVYYYRASTGGGALVSDVASFRTPPAADSEAPLRLVAMSDMQQDGRHPEKWGEVIEEGVLAWVDEELGGALHDALSMVLLAGDLVDDGTVHEEWTEQFFAPAAPLFAHVPVYPVLGNHEANANMYFDYFHLPAVGNPAFDEHWWSIDYSNVRVVGLDSNGVYALPPQLGYLDSVLEESCDDEHIDFVFVQLHHPYLSELWTPGESGFTGQVVARLDAFTERCGKPSVHFFGHTHGYSRGQSRDHQHVWVNVASAGGALDRWGEQPQRDYEEFVVSQDEYGFVVVEVSAGDDPTLSLRRISRGDPEEPLDNVVSDELVVRRYNRAPRRPATRATVPTAVGAECIWLAGSSFRDPDGDELAAAHWQIARDCGDEGGDGFGDIVWDEWRQAANYYLDQDTRAGLALDDERVLHLEPGSYCWRVRYRDASLSWSAWSEPAPLTVAAPEYGENLLENPGAEDGAAGWTVVEAPLEALAAGECGAPEPASGEHLFVVGGMCEPAAYGEARQAIDLSEVAEAIDGGGQQLRFAGWMRIDAGGDEPSLWVEAFDGDGERIAESEHLVGRRVTWTRAEGVVVLPVGARRAEFVIAGRRRNGDDNDSYFDDLYLGLEDASDCVAPAVDPDEPPPEDLGGLDAGSDAGGDMGGDMAPDTEGDADSDMADDAAGVDAEETDGIGFDGGIGGDTGGGEPGGDADAGGSDGGDDGCGCRATRGGGAGGGGVIWWLLAAGLAATRRRRGY